jgi:hypothetical protein
MQTFKLLENEEIIETYEAEFFIYTRKDITKKILIGEKDENADVPGLITITSRRLIVEGSYTTQKHLGAIIPLVPTSRKKNRGYYGDFSISELINYKTDFMGISVHFNNHGNIKKRKPNWNKITLRINVGSKKYRQDIVSAIEKARSYNLFTNEAGKINSHLYSAY